MDFSGKALHLLQNQEKITDHGREIKNYSS